MQRRAAAVACLLVGVLVVWSAAAKRANDDTRTFSFTYATRIGPVVAGSGAVEVFVPLVRPSEQQSVVSERVEASIPGVIETEERYGNRYWHGSLAEADGRVIEVRVETRVERRSTVRVAETDLSGPVLAAELERFLGANERVAVGDEVLDPILSEIRTAAVSDQPAALARATYDWVVDNVEYKKTGTGWGNGDTYWACSERYGNCTDFHALFISLARTLGIPARFEIGFPIPEDRSDGEVEGYHCWVEFYLPETGWFPIDASEAFKQPEKREFFYGSHPNDRIHFTTGRDLRLGKRHTARPLNYFIYPYAEVAGKPWQGRVEKTFRYRRAKRGA